MENALYIGLSRQMILRREMEIIANNIANMDTNGFKVESMIQKTDPSEPAVTLGGPRPVKFVAPDGVARDFGQGVLTRTGGPLTTAFSQAPKRLSIRRSSAVTAGKVPKRA